MKLTTFGPTIDNALRSGSSDEMAAVLSRVREEIDSLREAERGPEGKFGSGEFIFNHFREVLKAAGVTGGTIAELGGPGNSFRDRMPEYEFEFLSIYPEEEDPAVHVADITYCPQIPDASFDGVFSVSVMEHVARPWAAAREIRRILKPGGIVYHAAPFSYFYHGAPMDFWRYTPEAMKQLFPDLECLHASFYSANRRRNNLGSAANPVDGDGGAQFSEDAFGGWRENWFTLYAGRKTEAAARNLNRRRMQQLAIDAVAMLQEGGTPEPDIYERAFETAPFNHSGTPPRCSTKRNLPAATISLGHEMGQSSSFHPRADRSDWPLDHPRPAARWGSKAVPQRSCSGIIDRCTPLPLSSLPGTIRSRSLSVCDR